MTLFIDAEPYITLYSGCLQAIVNGNTTCNSYINSIPQHLNILSTLSWKDTGEQYGDTECFTHEYNHIYITAIHVTHMLLHSQTI